MRILAIGAHSDDADEFAGGSLARYTDQGDAIGICCMTDGGAYGSVSPREALVATRKREFETSAGMMGATATYWLAYPDGGLEDTLAVRREVERVLRDFKPDLLLTHPRDDYHPDHIATHDLVVGASQVAWTSNTGPAVLYFWDSEGGHNFIPDAYVDISDKFEFKLRLMDVHRSQYDFGPDPVTGKIENFLYADVTALGLFRGMQSNVRYAEGFQSCHKHGRMRTYRVLP